MTIFVSVTTRYRYLITMGHWARSPWKSPSDLPQINGKIVTDLAREEPGKCEQQFPQDGVVGNMTKAEQLAANTRIDAATSPTWIPLDDLKVVFCSITEDLVQMITDTYRRIDNFARNNQQPPSSEAASRPNDAVVDIDAADADNELAAAEYVEGIFRSQKKKKTNNKVLDMVSSRVSDLPHQRGIAGEIKSKNVAGHGRQNRKFLITGREVDNQILISSLKKFSNLCRKHKDLYMWMVKSPSGPSVKFLVNAVHTMEELKLTGNHLKGSRHVFVFCIVDDHIWFRNYQIDKIARDIGNLVTGLGHWARSPWRSLATSLKSMERSLPIFQEKTGQMSNLPLIKEQMQQHQPHGSLSTISNWSSASITEDLVQMITDTYERIDKLARNTQQPPSSEDLPCASHNWGQTYRKQTILTISNTRQLHYGQFVKKISEQFKSFRLIKIPPSDSESVDTLVALVSSTNVDLRVTVPVEDIVMPSIDLSNPTYIINDVPVAMEIGDDPDNQANVKRLIRSCFLIDNGTQFTTRITKQFLAKWGIRLSTSTPRYPHGNDQAEATNKTIVDGIKKVFGKKKGCWSNHLDGVLWSHWTMLRRATGQSPFSFAYGIEAMATTEASVPTIWRCMMTDHPELNDEMMYDDIDMWEELRDQALMLRRRRNRSQNPRLLPLALTKMRKAANHAHFSRRTRETKTFTATLIVGSKAASGPKEGVIDIDVADANNELAVVE
ncbi:Integrase catalytic core [Arabidopsis suecica]|uniref:Integrase catalytic core n=1 Tax=Arabidopsis suecica TaxID=45249 RepID=A0A8T2AGE6_ARASU|nr:Integrase catalytic core [Arabidopsis suecica]